MTQPNTTANVVLSANVQPYQQAMQQAGSATNDVVKTVERLSLTIDGVFKKAGHRLELFSAGSLAGIGAAVASLSALDAQLDKVRATASLAGGTSVPKLADNLRQLTTQVPMSTNQLAQLSTTIQGLGVKGAENITKLTKTFAQLQAVTGESGVGLGQDLIQLTRSMGQNIDPAKMNQYASAVANVSANLGTSATAVTNFAQAIQPMGKAMGLTETQLIGLSGAFSKAGADGTAAATAFSRISQIITNDLQTGDPQLKQFADLLGMTTDQFATMAKTDPSRMFDSLFSALNQQGPKAIQFLQSIGLEGVRTVNSIQRVSQGGGLGAGFQAAQQGANDPGKLSRAASASFNDLQDQTARLGRTIKELTTGPFVTLERGLTKIVEGFNALLSVMVKFADLPGIKQLLQLAGLLAPVVSVIAGLAGAMLALLPTLAALGVAWRLVFNPTGISLLGGYKDAVRGVGAASSVAAQQIAAGNAGVMARGAYRAGGIFGAGAVRLGAGQPATGPGMMSRVATAGLTTAQYATRTFITRPAGVAVSGMTAGLRGGMTGIQQDAFNRRNVPLVVPTPPPGAANAAKASAAAAEAEIKAKQAAAAATAAETKAKVTETEATAANAKAKITDTEATAASTKAKVSETEASAAASVSLGRLAASAAAAGVGAAASGAGKAVGLAGAAAGRVGGALGGAAMGLVGSPLGATLVAGMAGYAYYNWVKGQGKMLSPEDSAKAGSGTFGGEINDFRQATGQAAQSLDDLGLAATKTAQALNKPPPVAGTTQPFGPEEIAAAVDTSFKVAGYNPKVQQSTQAQQAMLAGVVNNQLKQGALSEEAKQQYREQLAHIMPVDQATKVYSDMEKATNGFTIATTNMSQISEQTKGLTKSYEQNISNALSLPFRDPQNSRGSTRSLQAVMENIGQYANANYAAVSKGDQGAAQQSSASFLAALGGGAPPPGSTGSVKFFQALAKQIGVDKKYGTATTMDEFVQGLFDAKDPKTKAAASRLFTGITNIDQFTAIEAQPGGLTAYAQNQYTAGGQKVTAQTQAMTAKQFQDYNLGLLGVAPGSRAATASTQVLSGNVSAAQQNKATSDAVYGDATALMAQAHSAAEAQQALSTWQRQLNSSSSAANDLAAAVRGVAESMIDANRSTMSLPQKLADMASELAQVDPNQDKARYDALQSGMQQTVQAGIQQAQQYLLAQHQLNIQLTQGQEDYQKQVGRSTTQFNLQQSRAVYNNNLQTARSIEDFHTQELQSEEDFNLSMLQAQQDYQKSMAHATRDFVHSESEYIKSVAESLDPWAQVQARSTTDAQQALANIDQQNKMFAQAGQQLDQLRKMGLNQNVIDVLGLSDPKNMQQLNRFFTDVAASPDLVGAFNESIKGRLDWTAGLATNESSTQWQAMEYQFNTAASDAADSFTTTSDRAQAAFEKQQTRSETAFDKMLGRNATDFQTMTQQSQADFALQMANMASDYETSVQRSLSAVNDFANEAYGTNDQIMSAAMATASGNMKIFFQNISDAYGVMKSGVDAASAGAIAAAAGGSPALGTANNRNATAGTLGYNESGQVGTYDASGKFSPYTGFVGQALANSLPQIANPTTASNAIDANTANMTVSDHMAIMKKALAIAGMEVSAANLNMLDILISHESGWNPNAINLWDSNAKAGHPSQGLMQTIPSTFEGNRDKRLPDSITNPIANMVAGLNYVKNRYGSLGNLAGEKSVAHGGPWIGYAAGGLFNAPKNIQVGEAGPEMVLPLNNRGVDFLLSVSRQLNNDGWAARNSNQYASRVAPSISTTTVDSSTNFTGPVTVQAQDPNAMADALKQKARMMALTRPDMVSGLV